MSSLFSHASLVGRASLAAILVFVCQGLFAQVDRKEVRSGNRQFRKEAWQDAEIDYRRALVKDSTSFAGAYNLASALYRQDNFEEAAKSLERLKEVAPVREEAPDYFYNSGNVAVKKKDWAAAVEAYKQSLLRNPSDLEAKENYIYAKLMLKDQENGGGGGGDDQQDQNQDQNQDKDDQSQDNQDQDNKNQNQDQDQGDGGQDNKDQPQPQPQPSEGGQQEAKISPQQAQQMLKAIQAKEKATQDKVNKEKAALLQSRQREKNW